LRGIFTGISGEGLKARILRAGLGGLGIRIFSLLATLLSSVVLARVLGDAGYGVYVFVLAITTLLALPVQVGLPILVIRETASAEAARDWVALYSIRDWAIRVNFIFGSAVITGALLFISFGKDLMSIESHHALWVAAALVLPLALASTLSATLRGLRWVMAGLYPSEVIRPLLISAIVGGWAYFCAGSLSPEVALVMNFVATILVVSLLLVLVARALPADSRGVSERVFRTRSWLRSLMPLAMMSSLHLVNQNTDLVMLGIFRTAAEVGYYKVAVSGAGFVIFGLSAIQVVAMPYISRLYSQGDVDRLQRLASACAGASVLLALPVVAIYLVWGRPLLGLIYGQSFVASWEPLLVLSGAQLLNGFFGIIWPLLVMTGHEGAGFRGLAFATVANVVLNAALIPIWGAIGAATATGISLVIWNVLFWIAVRRYIGIDGSLLGLFRQSRNGKGSTV